MAFGNTPGRQEALLSGLKTYESHVKCKNGHSGLRYTRDDRCVECRNAAREKWEAKNPEWRKNNTAKWRAANQDKVRASSKKSNDKWPLHNPERRKAITLKASRTRQGLPEPTRPVGLNCECCGTPRSALKRELHLDHNHETGAFRGWLCGRCNVGIGMLGDNVAGLQRAIAYLERVQP